MRGRASSTFTRCPLMWWSLWLTTMSAKRYFQFEKKGQQKEAFKKLTHCVVIVKVDESVLSLGLVLVGDPKGPSDEAKVGKVLHQLGVVNAVFQAAHKHRLRLVRKLNPRPGQIYPNPLSLRDKTTIRE